MSAPCLKMVLLSDVSVGYGTPQILRMAESFARVFGAEVHIFEPDQSERQPVDIRAHVSSPHVHLTRIYTTAHPYLMQGRIEYCRRVAEFSRKIDPQIFLFSTMFGIELVDNFDTRDKIKIFYCLEGVDNNNDYMFPLIRDFDIVIFPEENRRRLYSERLDIIYSGIKNILMYNSNNLREWIEVSERRSRIFYGGGIDRKQNFADYFLNDEVKKMPIDLYGIIGGFEDNGAVEREFQIEENRVRFHGYMQADDAFFKLLSSYLYSIVIWNPDREDHLYACPNKFFDAIACGVPPICAPHPQCVQIIKKWNCGLLMDDWSYVSFKNTLERALRAVGSDYYNELVANCRCAMAEELSWDRQFEKLVPVVKKYLARRGVSA